MKKKQLKQTNKTKLKQNNLVIAKIHTWGFCETGYGIWQLGPGSEECVNLRLPAWAGHCLSSRKGVSSFVGLETEVSCHSAKWIRTGVRKCIHSVLWVWVVPACLCHHLGDRSFREQWDRGGDKCKRGVPWEHDYLRDEGETVYWWRQRVCGPEKRKNQEARSWKNRSQTKWTSRELEVDWQARSLQMGFIDTDMQSPLK